MYHDDLVMSGINIAWMGIIEDVPKATHLPLLIQDKEVAKDNTVDTVKRTDAGGAGVTSQGHRGVDEGLVNNVSSPREGPEIGSRAI